MLDSSCQGIKGLFLLAYNNKEGDNTVSVVSYEKYFRPKDYNIEINRRNFYDQAINDSIKQYDEIRKGDDYATGCVLDFAYFKKITD